MKKVIAALASASLLAAPVAAVSTSAQAQSHGGGFHGAMAGGMHGGGFHGAGRAGYAGRGYWRGGFGGYPYFYGGLFLGLALDAAWADPWFYGYPDYWDWYAPYGVAPPYGYGPPPNGYAPPPSQYQPQTNKRQACGSWVWDAGAAKYNWVAC